MAKAYVLTPARRVALRKAQLRSAELRRKGFGSKSTGGSATFYGRGKSGRRAARLSTYGSRKHGISIAQRQRRKQRANKIKKVVAGTTASAIYGAYVYSAVTTPAQRAKHSSKIRNAARSPKSAYHTHKTRKQFNKIVSANYSPKNIHGAKVKRRLI